MLYRRLGHTGLPVSVLSFGTWLNFGRQVGRDDVRNLVACAWDHGITLFDSTQAHGAGRAEQVLGDVIADLRLPRDGYCLASRVSDAEPSGSGTIRRGLSRKHVVDACDAALHRLRVDYLDLYVCGRPDPETPVEETVRAMDLLVRQGKVLYWGTSEWPLARIQQAMALARTEYLSAPVLEQPSYSLLQRRRLEHEYAPLAATGLGIVAGAPLAGGVLTGKYRHTVVADSRPGLAGGIGSERLASVQRFCAVARAAGESPAPLAIAWCLRNPQLSSIVVGASRVAQLRDNLGALAVLERHAADAALWSDVEAALSA